MKLLYISATLMGVFAIGEVAGILLIVAFITSLPWAALSAGFGTVFVYIAVYLVLEVRWWFGVRWTAGGWRNPTRSPPRLF